jgi:hypothetical protein
MLWTDYPWFCSRICIITDFYSLILNRETNIFIIANKIQSLLSKSWRRQRWAHKTQNEDNKQQQQKTLQNKKMIHTDPTKKSYKT